MAFASLTFIYMFLPVVLLAYFASPKKYKIFVLLAASYAFIAYINPIYVIPLIISTCTACLGGIYVSPEYESAFRKKPILAGCIAMNTALIIFSRFVFDMISTPNQQTFSFAYLMAPLGIAVYALQSTGYLLDVYKGNTPVERNFARLTAYLCFFPQIVAGPLVRYQTVRESFANPAPTVAKMSGGIGYFIKGLSKKVILANNMATLWQIIRMQDIRTLPAASAWIGIFAFAFQLYFEFSGYIDMSIGLGKIFGFELPENFANPLFGLYGVSDFLKRWNITVSNWIRNYIVTPFQKDSTKSYILFTFLLSILLGLWHGLHSHFIIWGIYLAIFILLEHFLFKGNLQAAPKILTFLYTLIVLSVGWVFFAFHDPGQILQYLNTMLFLGGTPFFNEQTINYLSNYGILFIFCILFSTRLGRTAAKKFPGVESIAKPFAEAAMLIICTAFLLNESFPSFFQ